MVAEASGLGLVLLDFWDTRSEAGRVLEESQVRTQDMANRLPPAFDLSTAREGQLKALGEDLSRTFETLATTIQGDPIRMLVTTILLAGGILLSGSANLV